MADHRFQEPAAPRRGLLGRFGGPHAVLEVRDGERQGALRWPFAHAEALRWAPRTGCLLLVAARHPHEVPSREDDERGELRLFAGSLETGDWFRVTHDWTDDPVELADGVLALAVPNGLRYLEADGTPIRSEMGGRFSWQAPGLSASPSGTRLAHLRWRGEVGHLAVSTVDASLVRTFPVSCERYRWWDDDTVAYVDAGALRLLDVTTGDTRPAWRGLREAPADDALDRARTPFHSRQDVAVDLTGLDLLGDRLCVGVRARAAGEVLLDAVLSVGSHGDAWLEHLLVAGPRTEGLEVLPGGAVAVERRLQTPDGSEPTVEVHGPAPEGWLDGWRPLPDGSRPRLGARAG